MKFVNTVASIVHVATHKYHGAANKNIGDAFLLVWRVEDAAATPPMGQDTVLKQLNEDAKKQRQLMDNALFAFLKVIVDVENASKRGGPLRAFAKMPEVRQCFGKAYRVQMGFGLHFGWAIEGRCAAGGDSVTGGGNALWLLSSFRLTLLLLVLVLVLVLVLFCCCGCWLSLLIHCDVSE